VRSRDTSPTCAVGDVLAVHDAEVHVEAPAQVGEVSLDRTPAGRPEDVADEEDLHELVGRYSACIV